LQFVKYRIVLCSEFQKETQFGFGKQMEHLASQCLVKINCQFNYQHDKTCKYHDDSQKKKKNDRNKKRKQKKEDEKCTTN
jgi:hypothetical protein